MPNPTYPTEGGGSKVDSIVNSAGYASLKRGYGRETPAGATTDTQHMGVSEIPAAVFAAASTSSPGQVSVSLPAVATGYNYLDGFSITGSGANATIVVQATISGLQTTNWGHYLAVPSGANVSITPYVVNLPHPLRASAPSTAIILTVPSFGTGNAGVSVAIWGHTST